MDEDEEKRVRAKRSGDRIGDDVDRLSDLPDNLLCHVLLNIPTKDVVKSSVLSKRWRDLWRDVPGLDLGFGDFPDYNEFVSFVDRFLGFNCESRLQKLKFEDRCLELKYEWDEPHVANVTRWINVVLKRKVQHVHVLESTWDVDKEVEIPSTVYTCESLVSLKLRDVILPDPESVSLPCVKVIHLDEVKFANDQALERLISGCSVLESLTINRNVHDNVKVLRVCSKSLLSFTHVGQCEENINDEDLVVAVDAPRLEYMWLSDHETDSFIISNLGSLVKLHMDVTFNLSSQKRFDPNDLQKRNVIRKFLVGISSVKDMDIASETLEAIYNYSRCERVPLLRNLSSLRAYFSDYRWEMLPVFLESCPNLKSLSLGFSKSPGEQPSSILPGHHCFLPTLEYVKIGKPMIDDEEAETKLVSYFLEKSTVLKKLTLFLNPDRKKEAPVILKKLLTIPRLSTSCQVVVSDTLTL
uniref:Putative FBD-associated F-box protein n=1 Tax=Noccaea caerulescens TaxID=107243 RepID=A0A1J3I731_NOCCA